MRLFLSGRLRALLNRDALKDLAVNVWGPFLLLRTLLAGVLLFAVQFFNTLPDRHATPQYPLLDPWIRWDSFYYLLIAKEGYGPNPWDNADAFFPLYPWIIRIFDYLMPLPVAALLAANLGALCAFSALYLLVCDLESREQAARTVWIGMLFPTSFFLSAAYAEPVYLAAITLAVLWWRRKQPVLAALASMAATLARPVGALCTTIPFAVGWLWSSRKWREIPWGVLGGAAGVPLLLWTHHRATGNPFGFMATREVKALGSDLYFRSTAHPLSILADEGLGFSLMRRLLNWSALGLTGAGVVHLLRRRELELALICLLCLATPLYFQRSWFDAFGMARYAVVAFPLFLVLARWVPEGHRARLLDSGFMMLQMVLALIFATWRWGE